MNCFRSLQTDNHLVFLNSSYRLPPEFVTRKLNTRITKRIGFQAVSIDDAFSYRNHKIAYAAYEPDLRWGWRDYSVLRVLDLNTRKDSRLTSKTKYFSPDISPDGQHIVAVNMVPSGKCFLDILDIRNGKIAKAGSQSGQPDLYLSEIFRAGSAGGCRSK